MKIQDLPKHKRPREKLIIRGVANLSNAELIAILIRTGVTGKNAIELAQQLLRQYSIQRMLQLSYEDLIKIPGIDSGKACSLVAALEIGRRAIQQYDDALPIIQSPQDALHHLSHLARYTKEHFVVLYINARNQLIQQHTISIGTINASLVHPREVFEPAIKFLASSLILAHNHPSGSLEPSMDDVAITKRLTSAGELLDIQIIDHLIISQKGWASFRQLNLI